MEIRIGSYYDPEEEIEIKISDEEDMFCIDFFSEIEKRIKWNK